MTFKENSKSTTKKMAFSVCGLVLSMLLAVSSMSCQTPAPTPVIPSATPHVPKPAEAWSADGIISIGEYSGNMSYGDYSIFWWSDQQNIYIAMEAKTSGWVALGIQPGSTMENADMVFGFVKDGEATVYDLFSTGPYGPHPVDTEIGGTNDILDFGGSESDGITRIEFKRALNTGDDYDNQLLKGANKIIWAYGSDDELTQKHTARGYGEINL
jgi:hypothetical protein